MAINKAKMKCNTPKRQVQGGKKFVVKACVNGKETIIRFGLILQLVNLLELDINVLLLRTRCLLVIGHAKNGKKKNLVP